MRIAVTAACWAIFVVGCGSDSADEDKDSGIDDGGWDEDEPPVVATLSGDLSLWIQMAGVGDDTCRGTITVDVDTEAEPPFQGTAHCEFEGPFARLGALEGELHGDFVGDGGAVEGISSVSAPGQDPTELPWEGVFNGESLRSHVEDTVVGDRFDIHYTIDFRAE